MKNKTIDLHYQSDRERIDNSYYYPEDERTPEKRVAYVMDLAKQELPEHIVVVTACPYITEAVVKCFRDDREFNCFIDGKLLDKEEDVQPIFAKFAKPMKDMISL